MKTLIIIPTYNEADNITELIKQVVALNLGVDILVVDDNSPDGTAEQVKNLQVSQPHLHLLNRPIKNGLGRAYLDGFAWAAEHNYEAAVEMDADLSHNPAALPALLSALEQHDFVIGSRYMPGGGVVNWPWWRRLLSRGGSLYARLILRLPFADLTGGFNAWRLTLLKKINLNTIKSNGYSFQIELKARAARAGGRGTEVPITFIERRAGQSKMSGRIAAEAIWRVWQIAWREVNKKTLLTLAPLALIIAATIITYAPLINNQLLDWDDQVQITENKDVQEITLSNLQKIFTSFYAGMYQPLTSLSYLITYHFFGPNPLPFHLGNLALHLLNIILVWLLIKRLSNRQSIALATAALFALHPLQVETVAWASARSTLLFSTLLLATCLIYLKYLKNKRAKFYWLAFIFFLLALAAKSAALILPLLLLLFDWWKNKKITWRDWFAKTPWWLAATAAGLATFYGRQLEGHLFKLSAYTLWEKILLIFYAPFFYLKKLVWPLNLSAAYPYPDKINGLLPLEFYLGPLLVLILIGAVIYFRKKSIVLLAAGWFIINLLLVLKIVPVSDQLATDRYAYLPAIGFFLLLAWAGKIINAKLPQLKIFLTIALLIYLALLAILSWQRVKIWHDDLTLWNDALRQYPKIYGLYDLRGSAKRELGDYAGALADFNTAIKLQPYFLSAYNNRALLLAEVIGDYPAALSDNNMVLKLDPDQPIFFYNRGNTKIRLKDFPGAIDDFNEAIKRFPHQLYYFHRGNCYFELSNYAAAAADYQEVIARQPNFQLAHLHLGLAQILLKQVAAGCQELNIARELGAAPAAALLQRHCSK